MDRTRLSLAFAALAVLPVILPRRGSGEAIPPGSGDARATARSYDGEIWTDRPSPVRLALPDDGDALTFAVFGDRTGGPDEGVEVLAEAVAETNLFGPELVMTVGDLIQGYNQTPEWLAQMSEYTGIMNGLDCPWYPVAGNHDVYWRGPEGERPPGEHEANYEDHFGPLWYALRHKGSVFVVLYSDEGNPETGEKSFREPGAQRMSPEQFAFLDETLQKSADADHVFVFLHHPRWIGGGYGDDWDRVHARLAEAGNVRAVFAGHIHKMRYDGPRDGIEYFTLATVGGGQSGRVPDAGYLHHYLLVTARAGDLDVVSVPVGAPDDPRAITGVVSSDAGALANGLPVSWGLPAALDASGGLRGAVRATLRNPLDRPVDVELSATSSDRDWTLDVDEASFRLEPRGARDVSIELAREAGGIDANFGLPTLAVELRYVADTGVFSIPPRSYDVPLDLASLPRPERPRTERVLALDGVDDCAVVDSGELDLPDGPLTLEAWFRADAFAAREGLVAKTESSEFGLFVSEGRLDWSVHLDGRYVTVRSEGGALEPNTWHHVAGVFDGAEVRVYLDGELVDRAAASGSRTRNGLPLIVGGDVDGGGRLTSPFSGELDEVRLSRVARYAGARFVPERRLGADPNTALWLPMDGAAGPLLFGSGPERRIGRLEGGAVLISGTADSGAR